MITRIVVKNFRGIAAREIDVPASGGIARGRNGAGKSSIVKAIRAALSAQDIGPDAIRLGADKAEILIDLSDLSVRRAITAAGSTLTVKTREGDTKSRPQTVLTDLLGTSPLDPLDLFLAKKAERRAKILAALPVTADLEFLRRYVPAIPDDFDTSGHGLDVIERLRAAAYAKRTAANASAKEARATAERTATEARTAAAAVGSRPAVAVDAARASLQRASADADGLRTRAYESARAIERTAKSRAKIGELRVEAAVEREDSPAPASDELARAEAALVAADRALKEAETTHVAAQAAVGILRTALARAHAAEARAKAAETQAAQIEETIAEAAVAPVADEQIASADAAVEAARAALTASLDAERATVLTKMAETLALSAKAAETEATRLDTVVRALANDAPAALLDASGGIPGIAVEGDEILIDGVNLDGLSSAEQMRLAVEVARRANAKSKILVVDGLERLDPEQLATFVKHATSDGWQLLATKVDAGDLVFDVIEPGA